MAKIIQRKSRAAVAYKTQRIIHSHKRGATPYAFLSQYRKIENRPRALECCIFDIHAKKSTTK